MCSGHVKQIRLYVTHKGSPQVYTFLNRLLSVRKTFKKFSMNKCQIPSKRLNKSYSYEVYNSLSGSFCVRFSEEFEKAGRWPLTKILCDQSHCQKLIREFFKGVTRRCRLSLCPIFKLSGKMESATCISTILSVWLGFKILSQPVIRFFVAILKMTEL